MRTRPIPRALVSWTIVPNLEHHTITNRYNSVDKNSVLRRYWRCTFGIRRSSGETTLPRVRDERLLPSRRLYCSSRTVQIATKWNLIEIVPQICSFGCTGLNPQGSKSKRVIAERGQKVVATKRSNGRENVTVVATINAAGEAMPPLIIFKGQRLQEDCIHSQRRRCAGSHLRSDRLVHDARACVLHFL